MSGELTGPATDEDFERLRHEAADWLSSYFDGSKVVAPAFTPDQWQAICMAIAVFADGEAQSRLAALSAQEDKL